MNSRTMGGIVIGYPTAPGLNGEADPVDRL